MTAEHHPAPSLAPAWLAAPEDINLVEPKLWPHGSHRDDQGQLVVGGIGVSRLASEFGTPLYVLDKATVLAKAREVRSAFTQAFSQVGTSIKPYYASKAFLSTEIVRWMLAEGYNIDVASGGELAFALAAGAPAERVSLHGNNKSDVELHQAVSLGLGSIIVDSLSEVDRVAEVAAKLGKTQPIQLRVNSGVHAHTHEFLATAREDQKFGIAIAEVEQVAKHVRGYAKELSLLGLHSHIGSQIFDSSGFVETIRRLMRVHAALTVDGKVPVLNVGGGFGIAYTRADQPKLISEIATEMASAFKEAADEFGVPVPTVSIEPGRAIVGQAGITLYRSGTIKDINITDDAGQAIGQRKYVSVDGGMSDNARPSLYEADYSALLVSRNSPAEPALSRVVGKHCESGDIVVNYEYLPADIAPGELVAVAATGAYCFSLSSNYNMLARPGVVAVSDGDAEWIVYPETVTDLLLRDPGASAEYIAGYGATLTDFTTQPDQEAR